MLLFKCATYVQLMNAIQIKRSLYPEVEADVVLSSISDFSKISKNLRNLNIFRKVICTSENFETNTQFKIKSPAERKRITQNPQNIFGEIPKDKYTDFFIGVPYAYDILLYYYLVKNGCQPTVHLYEEAQITYLLDWTAKIAVSGVFHEEYGADSITRCSKNCLLYEPDLYVGRGFSSFVTIPKISCDEETKRIYNSLFEYSTMPQEKYIFLEENFIGDANCVTDIDCLDELARYVGKENITVKMHPRSPHDRFTHKGYKLLTESKVPLEMLILNNDVSDKVFVTISSGGGVSCDVMFDKPVYSINLFKFMLIGKNFHVRETNFNKYFNRLMERINKNDISIFCPTNSEEFAEVIRYLEGGLYDE